MVIWLATKKQSCDNFFCNCVRHLKMKGPCLYLTFGCNSLANVYIKRMLELGEIQSNLILVKLGRTIFIPT